MQKFIFVLFTGVMFGFSASYASDFDTPQKAITTYREAWERGDSEKIEDCFYPEGSGYFEPPKSDKDKVHDCKQLGEKRLSADEIAKWNRKDTMLTLKDGDVEIREKCMVGKTKTTYVYSLRKVEDQWKIIGKRKD